ncbi:hypothetical protein [Ascidiimonas aurantiaca]|uniref:hypothetical protein n=1 Tax=Ascidiimonas aurantiaca TaxID=1685432 RepID=UPI0030EF5BCE
MKQGEERFHLAKEEKNETRNYIFQKNKKTWIGFIFILIVLLILILLVILSGAIL